MLRQYLDNNSYQLYAPSFQLYLISINEIIELYFFTPCIMLINFKRPVKTWVKISKVMPQPKSISPGKGREALWQKFQIFRLKYGMA